MNEPLFKATFELTRESSLGQTVLLLVFFVLSQTEHIKQNFSIVED